MYYPPIFGFKLKIMKIKVIFFQATWIFSSVRSMSSKNDLWSQWKGGDFAQILEKNEIYGDLKIWAWDLRDQAISDLGLVIFH